MQAYSIETIVTQDGKVDLDALPFLAGETVQVIILPSKRVQKRKTYSLLKGSVVEYINPLEPIAMDDWAILQ